MVLPFNIQESGHDYFVARCLCVDSDVFSIQILIKSILCFPFPQSGCKSDTYSETVFTFRKKCGKLNSRKVGV